MRASSEMVPTMHWPARRPHRKVTSPAIISPKLEDMIVLHTETREQGLMEYQLIAEGATQSQCCWIGCAGYPIDCRGRSCDRLCGSASDRRPGTHKGCPYAQSIGLGAVRAPNRDAPTDGGQARCRGGGCAQHNFKKCVKRRQKSVQARGFQKYVWVSRRRP